MSVRHAAGLLAVALLSPAAAYADADVIPLKFMSMELARDIAQKAIEKCRSQGYQVAVVVSDRTGVPQVVMRDLLAPRFTLEIAEKKANAVILSGVSSGEFARNRADIRNEMNLVKGVVVMEGGLPVRAGGSLLGAVGVSGAPGGAKDAACAQAGLDAVADRLDFAP